MQMDLALVDLKVLDEIYHDLLHFRDDAGTEYPFTCAKTICGPNDSQAIMFNKLLEAMFNSMNVNETKFHTCKGRFFDLNNNTTNSKRRRTRILFI